jgi:rare lipoprotein A (peptidoglycan hydrolase)
MKNVFAVLCLALPVLGAVPGGPAAAPGAAAYGPPHLDRSAFTRPVPSLEAAAVAKSVDEAAAPATGPGSAVTVSWYGAKFYGRRTACGQTYTSEVLGVAHRSLRCGTPVTLRRGATTLTVPVVDRGPYVAGREFDLTYATRVALGCTDLCRVTWLR